MAMALRKEIRMDGYTQDILDELMTSGKFGSEAAIIRTAIQKFADIQKLKASGGI